MNDKQQFKVGDKIVDNCQVYTIFKIQKSILLNGEKEDYIYYKPFFETDKHQSLTCSVPKSSLENANLRRPVNQKRIFKTLEILGKTPSVETKINASDADEYFKKNDPVKTARLLRILWVEKQDEEKILSTRKKNIYKNAMRHLIEEISVVQKIGLKKAGMKITRRLKRICPEKAQISD